MPQEKAQALREKGYVGKRVIAGIRPEHVDDAEFSVLPQDGATFESTIKVYELMGAEVYLYFDFDGVQMTARVDPKTKARTGEKVRFVVDVSQFHVFDKETEEVIVH